MHYPQAGPLTIVRVVLVTALGLAVPPQQLGAQPTTTRVSVGPMGTEGNGDTRRFPAISSDGRWVAFSSTATNLVAGDTNNAEDVFVHDRQTGTTTRVNVGPGGVQGNGYDTVMSPAISADGRWVAFHSDASNLVAGDTNGAQDVFVHDRQTATTSRVSVGPGGVQANPFGAPPGAARDAGSNFADISADGRWVMFLAYAYNLVEGDTNGALDVFVHDRHTATTTRVSVGSGGAQANNHSVMADISADGRWVVFVSSASNLVESDTNDADDVFVHDLQTGTTTRVSLGPGGVQANDRSGGSAISADGHVVVFWSYATNLVAGDTNDTADVFVHDRQTGTTTRVSLGPGGIQGNGVSIDAALSADGRWVAFSSTATNLVVGDANGWLDVFLHDRQPATTTRVSLGPGGGEANGVNNSPALSADGRWVAFHSSATNLVVGDANGDGDVFVHDRGDPRCAFALSPAAASIPATGASGAVLTLGSAQCPWTASSNDPSWLTVTSGASGAGFGTTSYVVAPNAGAERTGTVTIAGRTFTVTQANPSMPEPPAALVASSVLGNIVTVRWAIPPVGPAPTAFVLEGGVTPGDVLASVPTGTSAPTFTFAAPSGSFYLRVHAMSGTFRSAASNEIRIHVGVPVAPSPPANLLGLADGSTLALAWTNTYAGSAPASIMLNVTGDLNGSLPVAPTDSFRVSGVPPGTYTFSVVATNAGGSSPRSNPVTLTFPAACGGGAPGTVANFVAYRVGRAVFLGWDPPSRGAAPTSYVLKVTGAYVGSIPTPLRALSGVVPPGVYTFSVVATNECGASAETAPQTVVVP